MVCIARAWLRTICIAIQWIVLWLRQGSAVLQYSHCSSDTACRRWAGRAGAGLGVQALGRRAGRRQSAGAHGSRWRRWAGTRARKQARADGRAGRAAWQGERGAQAAGRQARARQGAGSARQGTAGARPGSWACGLGMRASQGCALRLVFNPVFRLGSFPESLMNTVHCKINFEKKNILNLIKIK